MKTKLMLFILMLSLVFSVSVVFAQEDVSGTDSSSGDLEDVEEKEGYVTFDFKNADIRNVLRIFSHKTGINIVAGKEVSGSVTITLRDVPWEKALKLVLSINGYGYVRDGNVIKVLTLEQLAMEPLDTRVYQLNYAKPDDVKATVEKILSERGMINVDQRAGLLIVTDVPSKFKDLDMVIARIDAPTAQVLIEGQIVEATLTDTDKLGIKWDFLEEYTLGFSEKTTIMDYSQERVLTETAEWGTAKEGTQSYSWYPNQEDIHGRRYGGTSAIAGDTWSIAQELTDGSASDIDIATSVLRSAVMEAGAAQIVLSYLLKDSGTDILSSPHIVTTDNLEAEIMVGEQYPLANYVFNQDTGRLEVQGFDYKDIGIKLSILPKVSPDGYVTMTIKPEVSDRGDDISFGGSAGTTVPIINTKTASTTVLVKDGDTVVIGGLIKQTDTWGKSKVRFVGDIPVLGQFFRHRSKVVAKKNLIIFMTPTIIRMENFMDVTNKKKDEYAGQRDTYKDKYETDLYPSVGEESTEETTEE